MSGILAFAGYYSLKEVRRFGGHSIFAEEDGHGEMGLESVAEKVGREKREAVEEREEREGGERKRVDGEEGEEVGGSEGGEERDEGRGGVED